MLVSTEKTVIFAIDLRYFFDVKELWQHSCTYGITVQPATDINTKNSNISVNSQIILIAGKLRGLFAKNALFTVNVGPIK